jgi:hypothetical protein
VANPSILRTADSGAEICLSRNMTEKVALATGNGCDRQWLLAGAAARVRGIGPPRRERPAVAPGKGVRSPSSVR